MKKQLFLLSTLLTTLLSNSQQVSFQKSKVDYKISFENLSQQNEANLGFVGIGADLYIFEKAPNLYTSISSFSAITGERPGLITLGMGLGYAQQLPKTSLGYDVGFYLGGGGGGGADDGGGLITRLHANLKYKFNYFTLFAGVSRLDFPTGSIGNTNFNFGISIPSFFTFGHTTTKNSTSFHTDQIEKSTFRVGILGSRYLKFQEGPFSNQNKPKAPIQLIGFEFDKFITNKLYGTLKINGAVTGGVDGYMSLLVGLGLEQPLIKNTLAVDVQLLAGPSGGGAIDSGGGATFQGTLGLRANLSKTVQFKASYGQTGVPKGNLKGNFIEFNLSKTFNFLQPENTTYQLSNSDKLQNFGIEILNRTYFSPSKLDKNNKPYDKVFNLIGFQASKNIYKKFDLTGATFWAYQGSYGAYAEGWLGLQYNWNLPNNFVILPKAAIGTAGGGGIDLGSGLVYQYNLAVVKNINNKFGITLTAGQMAGFKGNFNPIALDLGLKYNFSQVISK